MKVWWFANIPSIQQVLIVNHYFAFRYMARQNPVNIAIKRFYHRIIPQTPEHFIIDFNPASCHRVCLL